MPTSTYALTAAKQLVGSWPHAQPPEPKVYAASIAATLAKYPVAIVAECADPRTGLALEREFPPTVKAVADWCEARLQHYEQLARWQPKEEKAEREFTDEERALAKRFLAELAAELKSRNGIPIASALTARPAEAAE